MKYRLLALDVDGTIVGPDSVVSPDLIAALGIAQDAGMRICLATGRSFVETIGVWRQLGLRDPFEPMVVVGGSLVSQPDTGGTLYQQTIPRDDAWDYADALCDRGFSAMAIVDAWRYGLDYIIAESTDKRYIDENWFSKMKVNVRRVSRLRQAADMPPALRINAVAAPDAAKGFLTEPPLVGHVPPKGTLSKMADELAARFAGRLNIHSIFAPNYGITVVEAFAAAATKWSGVSYVAQAHRIGAGQIVAVGDDVNDLPMLQSAGLGVTLPWAKDEVKRHAKSIAEPTLPEFIRRIVREN